MRRRQKGKTMAKTKTTKHQAELIGFYKGSPDTLWRIGDDVYRVTSKAGELDVRGLPLAKRWEANLETFMRYAKLGAFPEIQLL